MKNKRGISLIVLIITIVVIIILAAAIIISLDDDPIDSADRAVESNDLAVLKEAVSIAKAQYRLSDKSMTQDEYILDYLDRNGIAYTGYHIENGKLVEGEQIKVVIPDDWIDISKSTPWNGLSLLIGKPAEASSATIKFKVTSTAKYSVDWGDGSSNTSIASGTEVSHTYSTNNDKLSTDGYLFEVKITPVGGDITKFQHTQTTNSPLLWCQVGCDTLTNCRDMLSNASKLKKFGTSTETSLSKVIDVEYMFYGCSSLTSVPKFDTSNVTNMWGMFDGCSSLKTIPLLDTSRVTSLEETFINCSNLESIPPLDTSQVNDMYFTFLGCSSLANITKLDISKVTLFDTTFSGCGNLKSLNIANTNLTNTQINNLFNELPKSTKNAVIDITGNPGESSCTRATATGKGWVVIP